jgi:transposase
MIDGEFMQNINFESCTTADGRSTKTFSFDNTREGLDILWNMVLASKTGFQCNEVIIGYESTGPYGELPIHCLKQKPVIAICFDSKDSLYAKSDGVQY